ncbi:unnamed protein product [Closterium sp. Yama58-4]|nr:unnamed protein product [Closterium sp. Yama58-4]
MASAEVIRISECKAAVVARLRNLDAAEWGMLWENAAAADEEEEEPLERVPHSAPFSLSSPMAGAAGAIGARRRAWREKMRSFGRQLMPRRGSCDDLNAITAVTVTQAKRAKSFPESKGRGDEKGARGGRSRCADSRGMWRSVYEPRWLEEGLAEASGDEERRPHVAIRDEMGMRDDTAQRAADAGAVAGREGSLTSLTAPTTQHTVRASIMATPRLTARPPSPFVAAGKSGLCCKCHVARVYALMVFVSLLALLLFLLVPWAASHGAVRATAGDAVAVAEAGSGGRVRGWGRDPQLERADSLQFGDNGGIAESAMRMGGEQAGMIREKAVPMADAVTAVASSEAAFKGDEASGMGTGEAQEREPSVSPRQQPPCGPCHVPLSAHAVLTSSSPSSAPPSPHLSPSAFHPPPHRTPPHQFRWRFANRLQVQLRHGMPADWRFKGNSLRPRVDGNVVGGVAQDDGWVEGEGEGGRGGGGGGGGESVQVPQFVEGHGVHIEQYAAEYWLTLSLLSDQLPSLQRVRRAEDAHIVFVPAFSSAFYATQMKINEKRRRAGDARVPEERHVLSAVTQHALWTGTGEQGGAASHGVEGRQGEGELLEKVKVATGEGSPGGGGGGAGEAGGSSRRRLLRVLKGGRKGKEAEAGEQAKDAHVEGQQRPDVGAGGAERGDAAASLQSEGGTGSLVSRRRDFLIPAVHPHALSTVRHEMAAAHMLMVDFSQPAEQVAHLEKDVLVPYSALIPPFLNDSLPGEAQGGQGRVGGAEAVAAWAGARPTLIFFRGTLNRQQGGAMRVQLARLLANVSGADIAEGSPLQGGVQAATAGMRASKFCLVPEGDTASSCRLFDAILSHCIPVVVSDSLDLPFEEALDYTAFALFLPQALALRPGYVEAFLRNVTHESAFAMWQRLREVAHHFVYSTPPKPGGAEDMIWQAVARRWAGDHYGRRYNRENQRRRRRVMEQLLEREGLSAADIVVRPRALPLM